MDLLIHQRTREPNLSSDDSQDVPVGSRWNNESNTGQTCVTELFYSPID
jgi:hypothetical protein